MMNPNSLKNLLLAKRFKKGHKKPVGAYSFEKGHKTNVGRKQTEGQKEKAKLFMTGNKHAVGSRGNKGQHWKVKNKSNMYGHTPWNKGISCDEKTKIKISERNKGKVRSEECRKRQSTRNKLLGVKPPIQSGDLNINWKGGVTPENVKIRNSVESDRWRVAVFERDKYLSIKSGTGGRLTVHHILNFSNHPELRFNINNGATLTREEHKEFHQQYGKKNNTLEQLLEQLNEFLKQNQK